tara:strand:- start:377 stop:568 length:192 start_codon:yes stop_codon:yes gene_type:complete
LGKLFLGNYIFHEAPCQNDLLAFGTIPFSIEPGEAVEVEAYVNCCSGLGIDEFTFEIHELIWD